MKPFVNIIELKMRNMKIKIKVDKDLCIGAASCVTISPDTFQLDDENIAYVLDHGEESEGRKYEREMEVTADEYENILLGAQSCPTLAVLIYNEEGNQIFPEA